MATKKQLVSLLNEWYESTGASEEPVNHEDEEDFLVCVQDALYELGLCNGCRWYFRAGRSCEKETSGYRTCMNRLYRKLLEMTKKDDTDKETDNGRKD